jgi:G3E family GTPase
MDNTFRISLLTSIDPVLRGTACFSIAMDNPDVIIISHDISDTGVRRVVSDAAGILEDETTELEHSCLSCAVREDLIPALQRFHALGRWSGAVVALPVTADSTPVTRSLHHETLRRRRLAGAQLSGVACVIDVCAIEADALGDDYLVDRRIALTEDDDRVVGEALAPMLAHADVVVAHGAADAALSSRWLVEHLRGPGSVVVTSVDELDCARLLNLLHRTQDALERVDPLVAPAPEADNAHGVWTLVLESERAMHPDRLRENIRRLASHPVRTRGHFWVPTRPASACAWDGAGGQLSIGDHGRWGRHPRRTRLVVTGMDGSRAEIEAAFNETLLTDEEVRQSWADKSDNLDEWLGAERY